ncbi:hypothetical protein CVT25_001406 [Psilocybe cyanescens]|uniref:Uncharacterized protein n=1 Tax=Psilocybe cyanescens TaxID=93625 RepID=A0A409WNG8_PSICY|nr:hypothetical protein CVT25_001406 [Psilocybe cyanescens]
MPCRQSAFPSTAMCRDDRSRTNAGLPEIDTSWQGQTHVLIATIQDPFLANERKSGVWWNDKRCENAQIAGNRYVALE